MLGFTMTGSKEPRLTVQGRMVMRVMLRCKTPQSVTVILIVPTNLRLTLQAPL
jgi:hypothetical protein